MYTPGWGCDGHSQSPACPHHAQAKLPELMQVPPRGAVKEKDKAAGKAAKEAAPAAAAAAAASKKAPP